MRMFGRRAKVPASGVNNKDTTSNKKTDATPTNNGDILHAVDKEPEDKSYLYLKYLIISCAALLFFLLASWLDFTYFDKNNHGIWIQEPKTYVSLFHEIAFALVIALIISIGIEAFARAEHNKLVKRQMDNLKRDVLRESLGVVVSRNMFDEVKDLVLLSPFERYSHRSEYHFRIIKIDEEDFMKCNVTTSYKMVNKTNVSQLFPISCYIEKPARKKLENHVKIDSIFIDGTRQSKDTLKDGNDNDKDTVTFKCFKHECPIPANDCLDVTISYTMIKELNDTEVWKVYIPEMA